MIVGRNRVGNIVLFRGPSAGAAVTAVVEVENTETVLADRFDSGCAIGGVGRVAVEIKDGRLVVLRGSCRATSVTPSATVISISLMPSRPASAGAGRIGEIHEQAVAEIGRDANHGIDRDKPRNEFHDEPIHPRFPTRRN